MISCSFINTNSTSTVSRINLRQYLRSRGILCVYEIRLLLSHSYLGFGLMPELPEVEGMRSRLERMTLSKRIVAVNAREQGGGSRQGLFDDRVITCDESSLIEALTDATVMKTGRKGKQMYIQMSNKKSLLFHMGLSGWLMLRGTHFPQYLSHDILNESWPPKFTKLELVFEDNSKVAFTDPIRLGKVRMFDQENLFLEPPLSKLAPDPLLDQIEVTDVYRLLQKSKAPIKAVLLNQDRVYSGIGNWVADEVTFQSNIHPSTPCNLLTLDQVTDMHYKILDIIKVATHCAYNNDDYPQHWLYHQRWRGKKTGGKMADGSDIYFETISGRTTAVVTPLKIKTDKLKVSDESIKEILTISSKKNKKTTRSSDNTM
jgi:formamidopyrimidine-DNA glycosylase